MDQQIVDWLRAESLAKPLNWMSRFILEKLVYQLEHIATVRVEGSKLASALETIVKTEAAAGASVIGAGWGSSAQLRTLDTKHLLINGRSIVPTHLYMVAMPQSLAEAHKLDLEGKGLASLLDAADLRLRDEKAALLDSTQLGTELETRFSRRPKAYFNLAPATAKFNRTSLRDPDKALANVPLEGRAAKGQESYELAGMADLGIDFRTFAVRATTEATYSRTEVNKISSNPKDEWTAGIRADRRVSKAKLNRVFVGWFRQSWFRDHVQAAITPTATGEPTTLLGQTFEKPNVSGKPVTPRVVKPTYRFWRVGAELDSLVATTWVSVKGVSLAFDRGRAASDRDALEIGGVSYPIGDFYQDPSGFLGARFAANPELFAAAQDLQFHYAEPRTQNRVQGDGTVEVTPPWKKFNGLKLTTTLRYRYYAQEATRPTFTANSSYLVKATLDWPILNRMKFGPFVEY